MKDSKTLADDVGKLLFESETSACNEVLAIFLEWFRKNSTTVWLGENSCLLALPLHDPKNDSISIRISRVDESSYLISDMGDSIDYISDLSGQYPLTKYLHERIEQIQTKYNFSPTDELSIVTTKDSLGLSISRLIHAYREIVSLEHKVTKRYPSLFRYQLEKKMSENNIDFASDINYNGLFEQSYKMDYTLVEDAAFLQTFSYDTPSEARGKMLSTSMFWANDWPYSEEESPMKVILFDDKRLPWKNSWAEKYLKTYAKPDNTLYWSKPEKFIEFAKALT